MTDKQDKPPPKQTIPVINPAFLAAMHRRETANRALMGCSNTFQSISKAVLVSSSGETPDDRSIKNALARAFQSCDPNSVRCVCEAFPSFAGTLANHPSEITSAFSSAARILDKERPANERYAAEDPPPSWIEKSKGLAECAKYAALNLNWAPASALSSAVCVSVDCSASLLSFCNDPVGAISDSAFLSVKSLDGHEAVVNFERHLDLLSIALECGHSMSDIRCSALSQTLSILVSKKPGSALGPVLAKLPPGVVSAAFPANPCPASIDAISLRSESGVKSSFSSMAKAIFSASKCTVFESALRLGDTEAALAIHAAGLKRVSDLPVNRVVHNPLSLLFAKAAGRDVATPIASFADSVRGSADEQTLLAILDGPAPDAPPSKSKLLAVWTDSLDPWVHAAIGVCQRVNEAWRNGRHGHSPEKVVDAISIIREISTLLAERLDSDPAKGLSQLRDLLSANPGWNSPMPIQFNGPESAPVEAICHESSILFHTKDARSITAKRSSPSSV